MKHTLEKVTPKHTTDWYIKWVASIFILIGILLTSNGVFPINLIFHVTGLSGWFVVAMMWNDRALIVINTASIVLIINGLLRHYYLGE
jgi:hypothetical protein|tara:strand:- start:205 stop:468 length:264 start_codon:yes stop_codon:yes gene_type:complete